MGQCDQCGNDYDKSFEVRIQGNAYTFDSFECAIQKLAPSCARCQCRVIGHGVEEAGVIYCGAHCAAMRGADEVRDRAP